MAVQSTMPSKAKKPLMKNVSPTMKSQTELVAEIAKISVVNAGIQAELKRSECIRKVQQDIIQNERKSKNSYQEENGKLHRELLEKQVGYFFIGVGIGLLLSLFFVPFIQL